MDTRCWTYLEYMCRFVSYIGGSAECRVKDRSLSSLYLDFSLWLILRLVGMVVIFLEVRNGRYQ